MTPKTLRALKGSIAKWVGIRAGRTVDRGTVNCPLCTQFYGAITCTRNGVQCPVAKKTGRGYCGGTPYIPWRLAGGYENTASTSVLKTLATAELMFLRSLLPRKRTK